MTTPHFESSTPGQRPSRERDAETGLRWSIRARGDVAGFVAAFTVVVVASRHNGSYFETSWGWLAMVFLGLAATGLVFMVSARLALLQSLFVAGMTAFVAWVGLSTAWSSSVPGSVREVERDLVYVGLALALAVFGRYLAAAGVALGLLAGITVVTGYSLTTRLFPTHFAAPDPTFDFQLSVPLGYWNALGLLSAMGAILAVGISARASSRALRMSSGAATCVIIPTMLFTFSRGAWVAAAMGFVAMLALDSRRIQLTLTTLAVALPVGLLVWLGLGSKPLTDEGATLAEATTSGQHFAIAVVFLAPCAAVLVELAHRCTARLDPTAAAELWFVAGVLGVAAVLVSTVLIAFGGPVGTAQRAWLAFGGTTTSDSLPGRLRSLGGNGRIEHWRVAVTGLRAHPVLGSGAGTYEQVWYRERGTDLVARDAHSLYLEVLAELGPIGLILLLGTLAVPIAGCVRFRSTPCVPAAAGAFTAFALHAAIDWDWEMVGVTMTAILAGTVGLLAAGSSDQPLVLAYRSRIFLASVALVGVAFAFVSFAGNSSVASSRRAAANGNLPVAIREAERASRLLRWSIEPWLARGEAYRAGNHLVLARTAFERATSMDPGNADAWLALSEVSVGQERRRALTRGRQLDPRGIGSATG